jgi:hypothetical protein
MSLPRARRSRRPCSIEHHGLFVILVEHNPSKLSVCFSVFCLARYDVNYCLRYAAYPLGSKTCQRTDGKLDISMMNVNSYSV